MQELGVVESLGPYLSSDLTQGAKKNLAILRLRTSKFPTGPSQAWSWLELGFGHEGRPHRGTRSLI